MQKFNILAFVKPASKSLNKIDFIHTRFSFFSPDQVGAYLFKEKEVEESSCNFHCYIENSLH